MSLQLISLPHEYYVGLSTGQLLKWRRRNAVTTLRILTKSCKYLKKTEALPKRCSIKELFWKFPQIHRKESAKESFFMAITLLIKNFLTGVRYDVRKIFQNRYSEENLWNQTKSKTEWKQRDGNSIFLDCRTF